MIAVKILAKRLDEVALVNIADDALIVLMFPVIPVKVVMVALAEVKSLIVPVVDVRLVIVPEAEVRLVVEATVADRLEMVVVARVEVPITSNVPDAFNEEVAVITPPVIDEAVRLLKNAVTPFMRLAKKLVDVAKANVPVEA